MDKISGPRCMGDRCVHSAKRTGIIAVHAARVKSGLHAGDNVAGPPARGLQPVVQAAALITGGRPVYTKSDDPPGRAGIRRAASRMKRRWLRMIRAITGAPSRVTVA